MPRIHWTWVFAALLVAVSLSSVSFQLVNGAVVSTEPEVRLRQGFRGLVPCTVIRKISTVSWKKGDVVENAVDVVTLDISNGHISGQGFEDGEFTVASNYSLIFENALSKDSGRYFCEVTDYGTGSKYRNQSDVTVFDPPVITDASRVLQYGDQAILRCQYEEAIYIVQWKKGRTKDDSEVLVQIVLDRDSNRTQREFPPGYQGWYNMTDNFSLVINSTRIQDGGRYFCLVSDLATSIILSNSTYVDVVASGTPFATMRATLGVLTPTTTAGNQTGGNDTVVIRGRSNTKLAAVSVVAIPLLVGLIICHRIYFGEIEPRDSGYQSLLQKKGHLVSFAELWHLVEGEQQADSLAEAINDLTGKNTGPTRTNSYSSGDVEAAPRINTKPEDMYSQLCDWKDGYQGQNQLEDLFQCLRNANLDDKVNRLQGFRKDVSKGIPPNMIKKFVWEINDKEKLAKILDKLNKSQQLDDQHFHLRAVECLISWHLDNTSKNPLVSLSLAMEDTECSTTDQNFFKDNGPISRISYVELWELANFRSAEDYLMKVRTLCGKLQDLDGQVSHDRGETPLTGNAVYLELCEWKQQESSRDHQKDLLLAVLKANGMASEAQHLEEFRAKDCKISINTIRRLIWGINDKEKVKAFMEDVKNSVNVPLTPLRPVIERDKMRSFRDAITALHLWSQASHSRNPLVSLCLSAERTDCSPADQEFFIGGGLLSYVELWELAHFSDYLDQISELCDELSEKDALHTGDATTTGTLYQSLCRWKRDPESHDHQRDLLMTALKARELSSVAKCIEDFSVHRMDKSDEFDLNILKCIIWSLKDETAVKKFLTEIFAPEKEPSLTGTRDVKKAAIAELQTWTKQEFTTNPLVLLSRTLERAGFETLAEEFCSGGPITFFELWQLAHIDNVNEYLNGLNSTASQLLESHSAESSTVTADSVYEKLCRWKTSCTRDYQWRVLTMAMEMNGLETNIEDLKKYRREQLSLPDEKLKHILWNLRDVSEHNRQDYLVRDVRTLLTKLGLRDAAKEIKESDAMQETVKRATSFLSAWMRNSEPGTNYVILLDLSLEEAGFSPIDREFFTSGLVP